MSAGELLAGRRVCVCVGPGGVGKTTTAAALATGLAAGGGRVAVVTIDPARRLADAFGLDALGDEPRRVPPARFEAHGLSIRGELWAMMLDPKRTFDGLVALLAPDAATRDAILANRVYGRLSTAVAGSHEFSAIAKLYELDRSGRFDAIVLDTPPSRNALDFLDAPARLRGFLEGRALQVLLAPSGTAAAVAARGSAVAFAGLRRLTGVNLLRDLSAFIRVLSAITPGFAERATAVERLLADPATTFVLVTSSRAAAVTEAAYFADRLGDAGLALGGVVVNRVHPLAVPEPAVDAATLAAGLGGDAGLALRALDTLRDLRTLAVRDARAVDRVRREIGVEELLLVPQFPRDVHDAEGIVAVHHFLFATARQARERLTAAAF